MPVDEERASTTLYVITIMIPERHLLKIIFQGYDANAVGKRTCTAEQRSSAWKTYQRPEQAVTPMSLLERPRRIDISLTNGFDLSLSLNIIYKINVNKINDK